MSDRERPKAPPPAPDPPGKPGVSGRVNFDDRGQAVWEWSVKTGMFDRNADTQRIRKLLERPNGLELVDHDSAPRPGTDDAAGGAQPSSGAPAAAGRPASKPAALPDRSVGFDPYERVERAAPAARTRESAGGDPYSSGPAKTPENVSFNPHERKPRK